MPTYEYKCKDCDSTFSVISSMWARRKNAKCPCCGSENTERLISRFSSGRGGEAGGPPGPSGPFC